jgi:D-serine deaminase-like pyridoxal phosphate-dependent protein
MKIFAYPPHLITPCLVVDRTRMQANIKRMSAALQQRGVVLRPHAKTHKNVHIAQLQMEAGAAGITVATLDEAEVFAAGGISDIFIAYTVWASEAKADRFRRLASQVNLRVGVDSVEALEQLARVMSGVRYEVLVEVNSGAGRCGVQAEAAADIAKAAIAFDVPVVGVFTHGGHAYNGIDVVQRAADDERRALEVAADAMRGAGLQVSVLSAGSSPTALLSSRPPVTEERPGAYVFGDAGSVVHETCSIDDIAAVVVATVVSTAATPGQFVIDAGSKVLGKEPAYSPYAGYGTIAQFPHATLQALSEEHGVVATNGGGAPEVGDVVAVVPNHICPVVSSVDELVIVDDGELVDVWPVDARGRSQFTRDRPH